MSPVFKDKVEQLLSYADIKIGGSRPWDIQIHDERFYKRVFADGSLGLGESYMDGWWDCQSLDQFCYRLIKGELQKKIKPSLGLFFLFLKYKLTNMQGKSRSWQVAEKHYNLGNKLYFSFLDPYLQYSCGYFAGTDDLKKAQEKKLEMMCLKLQIKPSDKVLDIGCGWGGFSKYAAKHYGCHVTGINISDEQIKHAREFTRGLPVETLKLDYRDLTGKFDKVVSVGMFEHVGVKNYCKFFQVVRNCMADDGLFLLHTIGDNQTVLAPDPWIDKYIFPNGKVPSIKQLAESIEGLFVMEDWHNFGKYYDKTLMAWFTNFNANWDNLKSDYDPKFYRMWKFYLLSCAALFRARQLQLWQIVFSKNGVPGGYDSVR